MTEEKTDQLDIPEKQAPTNFMLFASRQLSVSGKNCT